MVQAKKSPKQRLRMAAIITLAVLAVLTGGFLWYVSDYYRAEDTALAVLAQEDSITVRDDLTILSPSYPTDTAVIFYPGAKVEAGCLSAPARPAPADRRSPAFWWRCPSTWRSSTPDAAEDVISSVPGDPATGTLPDTPWAAPWPPSLPPDHPDQADGLILLGAYLYGDYPPEDTLTIYGSLNQSVEDKIDYTENVVEIEGGNHAQFGNYGPQKGDLPAGISAEEQQRQTVEVIQSFLADRSGT